MNLQKDISYVLGAKELVFLAALGEAEEFIGIESPYADDENIDMNKEWEAVKESLIQKGYVELNEQGKLIVDEILYASIITCCFCQALIEAELTKDRVTNTAKKVYLGKFMGVELYESHEEDKQYCIRPLKSFDRVEEIIKECMVLEYESLGMEDKIKLSEADFDSICRWCESNSISEVIEYLRGKGLSDESAASLTSAISDPKVNGSLLIREYKDNFGGKTTGIKMLGDGSILWAAEFLYEDGNHIEFSNVGNLESTKLVDGITAGLSQNYVLGMNKEA